MVIRILNKIKNRFFPPDGRKLLANRLSKKRSLGYQYEDEAYEALQQVKHHTMLPYEQLVSLYDQVVYCEKNQVPGCVVECGVWKGGASGLMAIASKKYAREPRAFYLFDAFDDICQPDEEHDEKKLVEEVKKITPDAFEQMEDGKPRPLTGIYDQWGGHGTLPEVKQLLEQQIQYPASHLFYVKGWFQDTVPVWKDKLPPIAILRLDGDWYESTKVCMDHLYPLLVKGGLCIIDDYGYNSGCRKAVHEYLEAHQEFPLMGKTEHLRYWIKP